MELAFAIIFNLINIISASYIKNNLDRNIVNKGVWYKKEGGGRNSDFIFGSSDDVEHSFDAFGDLQSPFLTNYVERSKRSNNNMESKNHQNKCKDKTKCLKEDDKPSLVRSKLLSTLKPASVFNDYPFEVAVLLNNNNDINDLNQNTEKYSTSDTNNDINVHKSAEIKRNTIDLNKDSYVTFTEKLSKAIDESDKTVFNKTRNDFETEIIKKIEIIEEFNNTQIPKIKNRNVFDKKDIAWQTAPVSGDNIYKVVPKSKEKINKMNERGLIKVLTMLTKTFKKIMKQHNDIKSIHNKLYNLNDDFVKSVELLTKKFEDFNKKYSQMMKVSKELKRMEDKLRDKETNFDNREKELSKNLIEFENQQKKFLSQQRQFYNVQKVMLEQNEKINIKQNMIAKTQSEISHRQNNFARILKKAKQIYIDSKNLDTTVVKLRGELKKETKNTEPVTTESIKINLFSIPTESRIKNQDQLILDEKDSKPVDDLIYKYYFNNTFFDDILRNKILATFIASESTNNNGTKNKRNEINVKSTILLPVNKKIREKRWIKHYTNKKDIKHTANKPIKIKKGDTTDIKNVKNKNDPFMVMAFNFCKEIGQNLTVEVMNLCIEKALRRLQILDFNSSSIFTIGQKNLKAPVLVNERQSPQTEASSSIPQNQTPSVTSEPSNIFFPDNDELEEKLKEYELKPDTEGTVYYDGSLHSSDIGRIVDADSEGFSDIMPGLDSDSRIQVDPLALDLQAQRRADVRRINARILKMRMV